MKINVIGGEMEQKEIDSYVDYLNEKFPTKKIDTLNLKIDGDYVDMDYTFESVPFERIRRITGYLVGTTSRWNASKLAELKDRVTHDI